MNTKHALLRTLPKVDDVLAHTIISELLCNTPRQVVLDCIRMVLMGIRQEILSGCFEQDYIELAFVANMVKKQAQLLCTSSLRRVINATGVVLNTNLGRAKLSEQAVVQILEVANNYSNLEYDLEIGGRGLRYQHIEGLICKITGAESALVVNNNAAAVMLILSSICKGGEVIVSRGELVEIGGSFRVPDIMEQSGCTLREVGTTNKTNAFDYEKAIHVGKTHALMKIHTSNFKIVGFTQEVSVAELVAIGKEKDIPVIHDVGSGLLVDLKPFGVLDEPTVLESVKAGVDIISFSGDKLLGGSQAGIIIGKKIYIDEMKKNPLTRAFRIDKLTLAGLEGTLMAYQDVDYAMKSIPTLHMISQPLPQIKEKAQILYDALANYGAVMVDDFSQVGGGSAPSQMIPTYVVKISSGKISVNKIEAVLRTQSIPIITRITKDSVLFDLRTIADNEIEYVIHCVKEILE
ncbi:MAG: L-seryl-tRNA(Sec) selenium transferase [Oscillospiraceae bacterium]